jgi:glc operon protein GlcG
VYLLRPDSAQVASVNVTTDKARTAAIYRRPSKDFEDQASGGRPSALHLARAVPLQGGIPIQYDGHVIGAIGVSGASSADEDQELAVIGAKAAASAISESRANGAAFFSSSKVNEKFKKGGLLLDTQRYKIDAGRRVKPGEVEYHDHVTDVMHVVQGSATVVTGGNMVKPRKVGAGELRARAVRGGKKQRLSEGDVLAIPSGVPHQFTDVSDPFLYFVVKVEA